MTTPMMEQYRDAKERHPGMLLLFRMGDFYELFEDDAEVVSRALGLTLTTRDGSIPMAGFPHHALEPQLRKLIAAGYRVAICDQVEDPALAKGLVKREVTRVVTPGTLTEDNLLDPRETNHLAAICADGKKNDRIGLAWVELSTGQFYAADVPAQRLTDELGRIGLAECLFGEMTGEPLAGQIKEAFGQVTLTPRPDWNFDPASARATLFHHFSVSTMAGFGFHDDEPCLTCAGAMLLYLKETLKAGLGHLHRLRPYRHESYLLLDEVTRRSLELTRTLRDGARAGSLLESVDRTITSMGARLLQQWIAAPLGKRSAVELRLDAVEELAQESTLRRNVRELLSETFDLQRLTSRVSTGRAAPRDLAAVKKTLRLLPRIKAKITARHSEMLRDLEERLELCADLREVLEAGLVDDPPGTTKDGGVICDGFDKDLDELRSIARDGKTWLAHFQSDEITRTGIPSLKVGYNQVFGYYVEITHVHREKVPDNYQRKQTLKNAERYVTPELREHEEKVLTAQDKIYKLETDLFTALRDRVAEQSQELLTTAELLAALDVLCALAELAVARQYCRPTLSDERVLRVSEGKHPVLDQTLPPGTFVPNDVEMDAGSSRFLLITGPNMSGKSVYIRQVALIVLMAQMGSYVPAKEATIGMVDRIFTRVGASDELTRAQSTFMVEMTEAANILNNATERSLVILDEIGRGTSTYDGVSLAWAITEHLHDQIQCRALFATHYHELAELLEKLAAFRNLNVTVHEAADEDVIFLHKITLGHATKSYGIHVAKMAGVPPKVLLRARQILKDLEKQHLQMQDRRAAAGPKRPRLPQSSLFANVDDPVLQAMRELDAESLTPEQALEQLRRWQRELRSGR